MTIFSRTVFTIFLALLVTCAGPARPAENAPLAGGEAGARVETRERRLVVNGAPFFVRGVGYSPTPIGADPETAEPYGDYFTAAHHAVYDRDLPLLRELGANTVRLWGWKPTADHSAFLDAAYHQGSRPIYVIVSFWINAGQDLTDPAVRQGLIDDFVEMVSLHKRHPAVLMWAIGNELNAPWMYGNTEALFSLINEMARAAHQEEGADFHPVTTPLADVNLISTIQLREKIMPDLDVWSVQVYRGNTFGTLFDEYQAVSDKPLLVSEYGIDAYDDAHGDEYEKIGAAQQALYTASLWREIENCSVCTGGSIMAYSDEWWKGKYGQKDARHPNCPENDPTLQSACGYGNPAHPDGYANEEWWGIMRPVNNGNQPDILEPRGAYYTLQSLWVERVFLPVTVR